MSRAFWIVPLAAGLVACGGGGTHTITMGAQGDGGQSGKTTITETSTGVTVVINVAAGPGGVAQPAHIHTGTCGSNGPVLVGLSDVNGGSSTTALTQKWTDLKGGTYINVHASAADLGTIVSCGNVQ